MYQVVHHMYPQYISRSPQHLRWCCGLHVVDCKTYVVDNMWHMLWMTWLWPTTYPFDVVHNMSPTTYVSGVVHNIYLLLSTTYHVFSTTCSSRVVDNIAVEYIYVVDDIWYVAWVSITVFCCGQQILCCGCMWWTVLLWRTYLLWIPSICCGYMLWTTPVHCICCGCRYVVGNVYPQHISMFSTTYVGPIYVVGVCCGLQRVLPMV